MDKNTIDCCICFETIDNEKVKHLRCCHSFCIECIDKWLKIHNSCPLCRTPIIKKEKKQYKYKYNRGGGFMRLVSDGYFDSLFMSVAN